MKFPLEIRVHAEDEEGGRSSITAVHNVDRNDTSTVPGAVQVWYLMYERHTGMNTPQLILPGGESKGKATHRLIVARCARSLAKAKD